MEGPNDQGRAFFERPERSHLSYMGVRRARLGVKVVAVIPHHDEPDVAHGCVDGRSRSDHDGALTCRVREQDLEPTSVSFARPELSCENHRSEAALAHLAGQQLDIAMVRNDNDRVTVTANSRHHGVCQIEHPLRTLTRHRWQCTPRRPRRRSRSEGVEQCRPTVVSTPGVGGTRRCLARLLDPVGCFECLEVLPFRAGMAWREGQTKNIDQCAGVAVGYRPRQPRNRRSQHRQRRDDRAESRQAPGMIAAGATLEHITVDELPGKAHADANTWHRFCTLGLGDQVVEGTVEVRERNVDEHACDRIGARLGRGGRGLLASSAGFAARLRWGQIAERELVAAVGCLGHLSVLPDRADGDWQWWGSVSAPLIATPRPGRCAPT